MLPLEAGAIEDTELSGSLPRLAIEFSLNSCFDPADINPYFNSTLSRSKYPVIVSI